MPRFEDIKNVEYRLRRQSYGHSNDRVAVSMLLKKWSNLDSQGVGHNAETVKKFDCLYWQDYKCACDVQFRTSKKASYCYKKGGGCCSFFTVIQSAWQRQYIRHQVAKGQALVCGIDATGSISSLRWVLQTIVLIDNNLGGIPIGYALGPDEDAAVSVVLKKLI